MQLTEEQLKELGFNVSRRGYGQYPEKIDSIHLNYDNARELFDWCSSALDIADALGDYDEFPTLKRLIRDIVHATERSAEARIRAKLAERFESLLGD